MRLLPKSRRARRATVLLATTAVGVGVAGAAWAVTQDDSSSAPSTTTAEATVGTYEETVTSTGTFQPAETAELSFAVSGEVLSVDVAVGDVVTAGQALATVSTETLEAELDAAEATLDAARERLDSDTDADASETQLAADEASVAAAESRVAQAEEALDDATLTSTIAGTVASVDVAVGDEVSGGSSSSGGGDPSSASSSSSSSSSSGGTGAQITVITTDAFVVETSVGSADLARLQQGLQAELTPSDGGDVVYGTVSSVGLVATDTGSGTATFPVEIAVTGAVEGVYAGGSADVSITVEQHTDVLTVPSSAVTTTDGATTVTVVADDGSHVETPVEIGAAFGVQTEIVSGIEAGDEVVVPLPAGRGGGGGDDEGEPPGGRFPGGEIPGGEFPGGGGFSGGGFPGGGVRGGGQG
ncbi:efflux RND transporter periplasmic adaptor subunit [Jiangella sp. DSM 45060]|uniref:efflux RND transporter periplasmic adaptor subunit n=1 Tax=Jiangella sp. DSM 45060 TaxID=1798224 RepID=UPI0018D34C7C|nr:biotin/lipoyl-binding protein [Jiangella sp. DSM 45060]